MTKETATETIRPMTARDIDAVWEIDKLSFPSAWAKTSYLLDLSNPKCDYLVVEQGGRVVAYAGMWVIEEEAHVMTIAVHPDFRGRGISRRLLEAIIRLAIKRGAEMMTLEVRLANDVAIKLYESFGFTPTGNIKHYYLDTGEDALVMKLDPVRLPRR